MQPQKLEQVWWKEAEIDTNRLWVSVVLIRYANHHCYRSAFKAEELKSSSAPLGLIKTQRVPLGRQRLWQTLARGGAQIAFSKSLPSWLTKDLLLNEALCAQTWGSSNPAASSGCSALQWSARMSRGTSPSRSSMGGCHSVLVIDGVNNKWFLNQ